DGKRRRVLGIASVACFLDLRLQLLARVEGDHAPRGDRDLLAGLGVAPRSLGLVAQLEIAETRQLDALAALERVADLVEEGLDHVLGFALVQPDALEQHFGQFGFRQGERLRAVGRTGRRRLGLCRRGLRLLGRVVQMVRDRMAKLDHRIRHSHRICLQVFRKVQEADRSLACTARASRATIASTASAASASLNVRRVSCIHSRKARLFSLFSNPLPRYSSNSLTFFTTCAAGSWATADALSARSCAAGRAASTMIDRSRITGGNFETSSYTGTDRSRSGSRSSSATTAGCASSSSCSNAGWSSPIQPTGAPAIRMRALRPGCSATCGAGSNASVSPAIACRSPFTSKKSTRRVPAPHCSSSCGPNASNPTRRGCATPWTCCGPAMTAGSATTVRPSSIWRTRAALRFRYARSVSTSPPLSGVRMTSICAAIGFNSRIASRPLRRLSSTPATKL